MGVAATTVRDSGDNKMSVKSKCLHTRKDIHLIPQQLTQRCVHSDGTFQLVHWTSQACPTQHPSKVRGQSSEYNARVVQTDVQKRVGGRQSIKQGLTAYPGPAKCETMEKELDKEFKALVAEMKPHAKKLLPKSSKEQT